MQTTLVNQERRELDHGSVDLKHFILPPFAVLLYDSSGLLFVCLSVHAYIPSIALLKVHIFTYLLAVVHLTTFNATKDADNAFPLPIQKG